MLVVWSTVMLHATARSDDFREREMEEAALFHARHVDHQVPIFATEGERGVAVSAASRVDYCGRESAGCTLKETLDDAP